MFPKSGKFKYSFEKGKSWQSENLYAPFNFAVLKNSFDLENEVKEIKIKTPAYFDLIITDDNLDSIIDSKLFPFLEDLKNYPNKDSIINSVKFIALDIYNKGFSDINYDYDPNQKISIVSDNVVIKNLIFSKLLMPQDLSLYINNLVIGNGFSNNSNQINSILFEILQPNITFNKDLSQNATNEAISKVSMYRGMIDKETLIISKGEIVDKEKLIVLKSLQQEYENDA